MKLKTFISLVFMISSVLPSLARVIEIDDIWDIQYKKRPLIVVAYASWCKPCQIYEPIVERLSGEYEGKVDFYKVNVDNPDAEDFIDRYDVRSVPLTVFMWDPLGDATLEHTKERGLLSYDELKHYIEATIKKHHHESSSSETTTSTILHWEWGRSYARLEEFIPLMAHFEGK